MNRREIEYTPSQAAKLIGCTRPTITRAIKRGELKSRKFTPLYSSRFPCHAIRYSDLMAWNDWHKVHGRKKGRPSKSQPKSGSME